MLLEIGFPQETTVSTHKRVDFVGDLTFVETIAPSLADQSQRSRQRWIFENVAFCRCAARGTWSRHALAPLCVGRFIGPGVGPLPRQRVRFQKCAGQSFIQAWTECPVVRNQIGDWKTFLGITNRRGEIIA